MARKHLDRALVGDDPKGEIGVTGEGIDRSVRSKNTPAKLVACIPAIPRSPGTELMSVALRSSSQAGTGTLERRQQRDQQKFANHKNLHSPVGNCRQVWTDLLHSLIARTDPKYTIRESWDSNDRPATNTSPVASLMSETAQNAAQRSMSTCLH